MLRSIDLYNVFNYNNANDCMNFLHNWEQDTGLKVADVQIDAKKMIYDYVMSFANQKQEEKHEESQEEMACVTTGISDLRIINILANFHPCPELLELIESYDNCKYKTVYDIEEDSEPEATKNPETPEPVNFYIANRGQKKTGAGTGTRLHNTNAEGLKNKYAQNLRDFDAFFNRVTIETEQYITQGRRRRRLDTDSKDFVTYKQHPLGDTTVAKFRDDADRLFLFDIERGCFIMRTKEDSTLRDYICNSEDARNELGITIKDEDGKLKKHNISDYLLSIFIRYKVNPSQQDLCNHLSLIEEYTLGDMVVNHRNGDTLDNTRLNLEIVSTKCNNLHASMMKNISCYFPSIVQSFTYKRGNKQEKAYCFTDTYREGLEAVNMELWNESNNLYKIKAIRGNSGDFRPSMEKWQVENYLRKEGISL